MRPVIARPGQELLPHLHGVASLASHFSGPANAGYAQAIGILHDLGKATEQWQDYIHAGGRTSGQKSPGHVLEGTKDLITRYGGVGHLLAPAILGHHGHLPNTQDLDVTVTTDTPEICHTVLTAVQPALPSSLTAPKHALATDKPLADIAMWVRMLASSLVDADWTDSAGWLQKPLTHTDQWQALCEALDAHVTQLGADVAPSVRQAREGLYAAAKQGVTSAGVYTLTAPTGAGKTLAGLRLAAQVCASGLCRRVITAIPYVSITSQTAEIYRSIAQQANLSLLEHHSNLQDRIDRQAESWSDDIIVTTTVQLLESLYTARTARLRKVHNIRNSVILIDEPQSLPTYLLKPICASLDVLAKVYGCVIILTTATQPKLPVETISIPAQISMPTRYSVTIKPGVTSDDDVANLMADHPQCLMICNTRATARRLWSRIPDAYHLSTWMCSQHRQDVLAQIRERLFAGKPCRIVSTSLIECGVDISVPLVVREMAGLHNIIQAAGRANRHGTDECQGQVVVVSLANTAAYGSMGMAIATTREVARKHADIASGEAIQQYYDIMYGRLQARDMDTPDIMGMHGQTKSNLSGISIRYADISQAMQLIDDNGHDILVPYGDGKIWINRLKEGYQPNIKDIRNISRYTASVSHRDYQQIISRLKRCDTGRDGDVIDFADDNLYDCAGLAIANL